MATAAPRLRDDNRRRIRAFTLWLIGGVTLLAAGVLTYALVVGFAVPTTGTVQSVAPTQDDDRDLLVRATVVQCEELTGIEVDESRNEVTLTARATIPNGTQWDLSCPDVATAMFHTVRLSAPLGERTVVDSTRPDEDVPVLEDPADLLDPQHD